MAAYGTKRPAPQIKSPFNNAVVYEHGKGNKDGVELVKGGNPNTKIGK
jgi:hypothetical protein